MLNRFTRAARAFWGGTGGSAVPFFDAARPSARNKIRPSSDFARFGSTQVLRSTSRDGERNNPIAKALVSCLATNIVGGGIKPQLKAEAAVEFAGWTDGADFYGRHDFYGIQLAAVRQLVIDGEVFVVLRINPAQRVPLQIQLLGAEHLDGSRVGPRIDVEVSRR